MTLWSYIGDRFVQIVSNLFDELDKIVKAGEPQALSSYFESYLIGFQGGKIHKDTIKLLGEVTQVDLQTN